MAIVKKTAAKAAVSKSAAPIKPPKDPRKLRFYYSMFEGPGGGNVEIIVPGGTTTPVPGPGTPPHIVKTVRFSIAGDEFDAVISISRSARGG